MFKIVIVFIWVSIVSVVTLILSAIEFVVRLLYKTLINWRHRLDTPITQWAGTWFVENRKAAMTWLQH